MKKPAAFDFAWSYVFAEGIVEGEEKLFADRRSEISKLRNAVRRSRVIAIEGPLGSGKSTLLQRFHQDWDDDRKVAIYLRLATDAQPVLYRTILRAVLERCSTRNGRGRILLNRGSGIQVARELKLITNSIEEEISAQLAVGPRKAATLRSRNVRKSTPHDEASARALLKEIINYSRTDFFVSLDDFHHLSMHQQDGLYLNALLSLLQVVSEYFKSPRATFLVTMDDKATELRRKHQAERGGYSMLLADELLPLRPFGTAELLELIVRRLAMIETKPHWKSLIGSEALTILQLVTRGNPRAILHVLRSAMDHALDTQQTTPLSVADIRHVIEADGFAHQVDAIDMGILEFIQDHGPASSSNQQLAKHLKTSRETLRRRLNELEQKRVLFSYLQKRGQTKALVYELPPLPEFGF